MRASVDPVAIITSLIAILLAVMWFGLYHGVQICVLIVLFSVRSNRIGGKL